MACSSQPNLPIVSLVVSITKRRHSRCDHLPRNVRFASDVTTRSRLPVSVSVLALLLEHAHRAVRNALHEAVEGLVGALLLAAQLQRARVDAALVDDDEDVATCEESAKQR